MAHESVAVMDVGGTHVSAALVDLDQREIESGRVYREKLSSDADPAEFVATLVKCVSQLPARPGIPLAIALPEPFDFERGIARYAGVGKFDALYGFDLRSALTEQLAEAGPISF